MWKTKNQINDTSGIHQDDNMSSILFIFIIQAFIDTYMPTTKQAEFRFFPKHNNGNDNTLNGRLLNQPTQSKGKAFYLNKTFYVDDSFFLFNSYQDIEKATPNILKHFTRFCLIVHIVNGRIHSKTEAMFFLSTLNQAKQEVKEETMPEDLYYTNVTRINFTRHFKYLGSIITPELTEDTEIKAQINKAKLIMGRSRPFFNCHNVDKRIK